MRRSERRGIICCTAGMVQAEHGEAVERDIGDKLVVAGLSSPPAVPQWSRCSGSTLVTTAMVAGKRRKRAVALVRLDHHPLARAEPRVAAVSVHDAAVDDGRVQMRRRSPARTRPWTWSSSSCRACRRRRCDHRSRISSASISARRTTGMSFGRGRQRSPGCPDRTAVLTSRRPARSNLRSPGRARWRLGCLLSRSRRTFAPSAMSLPWTA